MALNYRDYLTSAIAASLAYKDYAEIQEGWREGKIEALHDVPACPKFYESKASTTAATAHAYSWIKDRIFYLTFRGTQSRPDILADIDVIRSQLFPEESDKNRILVHSGFLFYFRSLKYDIVKEIISSAHLFDTIHVTGHSLGGAIATIAAAVIGSLVNSPSPSPSVEEGSEENPVFKSKDVSKKRIVCHTIGSPRVGNTWFVKWFNRHVDESMRIVNNDDPVTLFPISCFYTHVSDTICIDAKCAVIQKKKDVDWYWRLFYLPFEINYKEPIVDHHCDLYIHRLMKLVSEM